MPGSPIGAEDETEEFSPAQTGLAQHHALILQAMEEVSQTPHGRLMIFAPPGSAKSSYASVVFPSRFLGARPNRRLILASYGDELARKMGRRTRSIVRQSRYTGIFGARLTTESQAAQSFSLTNGSEYMATGILSGVTGNRGDGLIIDDPVKGRKEADSQVIRDTTWGEYQDSLKTRLVPGGWIVLIQTRWHQDDLAGRILPENWKGESGLIKCRDGASWRVLCLQALCETESDPLGRKQGEYLWPEWFDRQHWAQFENLPITWASLYQQIPAPLEGGLFKPQNLQIIDALPIGGVRWVRGWDLASVAEGGDWTVGGKLGQLPDGRFVIADVVRDQLGPDERDALIYGTARLDGVETKISLPQDPGQAGKTQVLYLTRQLAGFNVHSSPESGSKIVRAEPFAAQVNAGNVLMVRGGWNERLVDEMRMFPQPPDDQIDALSRAFAAFIPAAGLFFA